MFAKARRDAQPLQASRSSGTRGNCVAFVTAADDIAGMDSAQIAKRLTIPQSPTGFRVIEFPTLSQGVTTPPPTAGAFMGVLASAGTIPRKLRRASEISPARTAEPRS